MSRYFTVTEANDALKELEPVVAQILDLRQEILARQPELAPVLQKLGRNGGNRAASQATFLFAQMESLIERVHAAGALFKDVNTGLLDFLSQRDGRDVYLCWRYGEPEVSYWHELDGGFVGRQPL